MSLESVKTHLKQWGCEKDVMEFDRPSATVEQAAEIIGVIPARIAKTLSLRGIGNKGILVVIAGDAKIDNKKFRDTFQMKARMLTAEEVADQTGHVVGGVCPFGLATEMEVYLDVSMQRFETLFPACGSINSAIELTKNEIYQYSSAKEWVDVCKGWEETEVKEKVTVDSDSH